MIKRLRITIPLHPRTKKNSSRIVTNKKTGKPFLIPSKEYKEYEADVGFIINASSGRGLKIDYPVNVQCIFYRKDHRRCDLPNLLNAIDDILVHCEVLADDNFNIIAGHDGSRVRVDKENPRTEICIEAIEKPEEW